MSRLSRLKSRSHGEDGKWAHDEIVRLRKQRDELRVALERIATAAGATWCNTDWIAAHAKAAIANVKPSCVSQATEYETQTNTLPTTITGATE